MFLSRLILNPRSRAVQRDLADPYQMHKTLSRGWPQESEYSRARVLFRVEDSERRAPSVLVQSKTAPDWSFLESGEYSHSDYVCDAPDAKEWMPHLEAGRVLAFRLLANPTVKRDGKRCGLYLEDERLRWLERKAKSGGFAHLSVNVRDEGRDVEKTAPDGNATRLRQMQIRLGERDAAFSVARFDGTLRVLDADAFRSALENGIGSAKGLGFGLLSVARA